MVPKLALRRGAAFGLAAVVLWIALYGIAAILLAGTPQGYNPTTNHVSDLGHPTAPGAWAFDAACILAGLLFMPYGIAVAREIGGRVGMIGAALFVTSSAFLVLVGVFPEESLFNLHVIVETGFFISLTVNALVLAVPLRHSRTFGRVSAYLASATVAGTAATVGTFGTEANPLIEHLAVFVALAWSAWNVGRMWAAPTPTPGTPRRPRTE